jgi:hypothetical protein
MALNDPYTHPGHCVCMLCRSEGINGWDLESCSWCTNLVPDHSLVETKDGARICNMCVGTREGQRAIGSEEDIEFSLLRSIDDVF